MKEKIIHFVIVGILAVCIIFLLFFNLGETYLTNWDEAWYADISRNMVQTVNFVTPTWNNEVFFEKPPLYFWLSSLFFTIFGVSEFTVRLTSAISGIGIAIVLYFLGKNLFGRYVGIISVIILFSSPQFLYRARTGNLDALLTFWVLLSFFAFYKGYISNKKWFLLMGFSLALGFLTKGVIGFYPLIPILLFLFFTKELKLLKEKLLQKGLLLGLGITFFWLFYSFSVNGDIFLNQFFVSNTEKFSFSLNTLNNFSLDYIQFLKSGLKIWFPLLLASIGFTLYKIKDKKFLFLLLYLLIFILIMSFVSNKSNWFILPIYPAVAILIGSTFYTVSKKILSEKAKWFITILIFLIALIQNIVYNKEYFVEDVAGDEARVAIFAQSVTKKEDTLYITNYYFPTTAFYSQRKVLAVYSERQDNGAWWIRPKTEWADIMEKDSITIITTLNELKELQSSFPDEQFEILFKSGTKLVVEKI